MTLKVNSWVVAGLLPLPQVKFRFAPTIGGLDWESSELVRAIRQLDQRVSDVELEP